VWVRGWVRARVCVCAACGRVGVGARACACAQVVHVLCEQDPSAAFLLNSVITDKQ